MPVSTLHNPDGSEALAGKPSSNAVVETFSQNKMESIIEAVMNHLVVTQEDSVVFQHHQNLETLAEGLVAPAIEGALVEIDKSRNGNPTSTGGKLDKAEARLSSTDQSEAEMETQSSTHNGHSNPVQCGLPPMGSLDYPDAPPTTPLLPEFERGRESFARKLKGGLAKVFLPSPPPPTPKDGQDESASALSDPQEDLMEHLMRSLPRSDSAGLEHVDRDHLEENVEVFAEVLSCSIINSALRTKS